MDKRKARQIITQNLILRYGKDAERTKKLIVEKYGLKPTITYYYYSVNPIQYAGEENVRKSLESICDQGDIVIGDYGSTDGIRELAKEYNVRIIDVEKTPNIFFHESKISNKITFKSEGNFLCYLNFNIVYPKNMASFCKNWLKTHDIKREILKLIGGIYQLDGSLVPRKGMSVSSLIYRPYLLHARGYDERTSYHRGTTEYAVCLLNGFYKLRWNTYDFDLRHRYYTHDEKVAYLKGKSNRLVANKNVGSVMDIVGNLFNNFGSRMQPFKNVVNSYW